tara:strand:- start:81 stop:1175 length:1095 start_codon:yes stop_codon:yes gene_type:complete
MSQIISLAEVRDRTDASRNGSFLARIFELGNEDKRVQYVSPYASNGVGAFVGIPEVGTEILVCKPGGSDDWYYLGATFTPEPLQVVGPRIPESDLLPLERAAPLLYKARGIPMQVQLTGAGGGGIVMSEEYNPDYINNKVEIKSSINKKITLSESPAISAIVLDSGNGSTIKLGDNPGEGTLPARSIEVESVGPQKYINTESQTDIVVKDGRELQLINNSTGINAADPEEVPKTGNVNIQSKWRDVNVFTQAEAGRIFIECLNENGSNQVIQIETNGAGGSIVIKTKGDIRLEAGNNIELVAGEQIIMQSGGKTSLGSEGLDIAAGGNANIDAGSIHLAEGASPTPPSIPTNQSTYGNTGITTY